MLLKAHQGEVVEFPYSTDQLRRDNPDVSFPATFPPETLEEFGVYQVKVASKPSFDPETHKLKKTPPDLVDGEWTQGWEVVPLTDDEKRLRVPESISRRQAKQQLYRDGLLDSVEPAIEAITDEQERVDTRIYWQDSQIFERDHPRLHAMASAIGLDEQSLYQTIKDASKL